jgi:large subunit ribosomal protein L22
MATRFKQKALQLSNNRDKRPTAHARYVRISPYKVRTVLGVVRGKPVNQALALLTNMPRGASEVVFKVISSAVANAENNLNLVRDDLFVAEIFASQGSHLKRMVPKAKGSSGSILKRTSHITVKLDEINDTQLKVTKVDENAGATKPRTSVKKGTPKTVKKQPTKKVGKTVGAKKSTKTVKADTSINGTKKEVVKPKAKKNDASAISKETDNGSKG